MPVCAYIYTGEHFYLYRCSRDSAYLLIDLHLCGIALIFLSMFLFISMSISLSLPIRGCILSKGDS